jgi:hypothetical protein
MSRSGRELLASPIVAGALLFVAGILYYVFFLRAFSHWWFEDDPERFAAAHAIANPLRFLYDREIIRDFSRAYAPVQLFSMWIDGVIAYRSVFVAQLHQLAVLQASLLLLFAVLRNFALTIGVAFVLSLLWLFLPTVIAVTHFLSAVHYLTGLAFSLGAILLAQRLRSGRAGISAPGLLLLLLIGAALSKEFFAITVPLAIAFYLRDRRSIAAAMLLIPPAYLLVRAWTVGGGANYGAPLLTAAEAAGAALLLPYMLAGNHGGYFLVGLAVALTAWLWWREQVSTAAVLCIVVCGASAMAVLYHVAYPIRLSWREHGTWYRAVFLVGTGLLLTISYALAKLPSRRGALRPRSCARSRRNRDAAEMARHEAALQSRRRILPRAPRAPPLLGITCDVVFAWARRNV